MSQCKHGIPQEPRSHGHLRGWRAAGDGRGGSVPRETGPRLLRMKRLVSQANEEEQDVSGLTSRPAVRLQRYRAKGTFRKKEGMGVQT